MNDTIEGRVLELQREAHMRAGGGRNEALVVGDLLALVEDLK